MAHSKKVTQSFLDSAQYLTTSILQYEGVYGEDFVSPGKDKFRNRDGAAARAGKALKQMHSCAEAFRFRFELFAMIDAYLAILDRQKAELPQGYSDVVRAAQPVREERT